AKLCRVCCISGCVGVEAFHGIWRAVHQLPGPKNGYARLPGQADVDLQIAVCSRKYRTKIELYGKYTVGYKNGALRKSCLVTVACQHVASGWGAAMGMTGVPVKQTWISR